MTPPEQSDKKERSWSLSADCINSLQDASIEKLVKVCKQAHYVDVQVRINGENRVYQADWIKHLKPAAPVPECGTTLEMATPGKYALKLSNPPVSTSGALPEEPTWDMIDAIRTYSPDLSPVDEAITRYKALRAVVLSAKQDRP